MMFKHLKTHLNFSVDPVCPISKHFFKGIIKSYFSIFFGSILSNIFIYSTDN